MPIYEYDCQCGNGFDVYLSLKDYLKPQRCNVCGLTATKVIRTAPMGFVQADVCYDSPIDGRHITNKFARLEDLARSNCVPYDPEMKTDAARRRDDWNKQLESTIDESVERQFEAMPTLKKEKLAAEIQSGLTAEIERK